MIGLNSGLIGVRRVPTTDSASGLWVPNEQSLAKRAAIWPSPPAPAARYYRLANFANTTLSSDTFDLSEVEVYDGNTKHTGITVTINFSWTSGFNSYLVDGDTSASSRSYKDGWSGVQSTATITLDLGSAKSVNYIKIFSLYSQPRFPASFDFQTSSDNSTFTTRATVTVGTSFTSLGGNVYSSEKVFIA